MAKLPTTTPPRPAQAVNPALAKGGANALQKPGLMTRGMARVDNGLRRVVGSLSRVNNFLFFSALIGGGLAKRGDVKGVGPVARALSKVITTPSEYMGKTSLSEAMHVPSKILGAVSNRMKKIAGVTAEGVQATEAINLKELVGQNAGGGRGAMLPLQAVDAASAALPPQLASAPSSGIRKVAANVASSLGIASDKVKVAENATKGALRSGAQKIFTPLGDAVGKVGDERRQKWAKGIAAKAGKQHSKALGSLTEVMGHADAAPVHSALKNAEGILLNGKKSGSIDTEELQTALKQAGEGLSSAVKAGANKKTIRGLQKQLGKIDAASSMFNQGSSKANTIADLPNTIKNAPDTLAKMNLKNVALKGAAVAGTAVQVTSTARGVADKIHVLKQMYTDMTGVEKISTRKLLMSSKVPPLVKEARRQIMKEFGPRMVLNLASTMATYGFMSSGGKQNMIMTGSFIVGGQILASKEQGYQLLSMYQALIQQPELQGEHYAALISAASKDAAQAGGVQSALVQETAKTYAQEKATPAEVLAEIQDGRFDERVTAIARANREAMERKGGHALAPRNNEAEREVLGKHTQRVIQQEQMSPNLVGAGAQLR